MASNGFVLGRGHSIKEAEMRGCQEEFEARVDELKGLKARDLVSAIRKEGNLNCEVGSSVISDGYVLQHHKKIEYASEISAPTTSLRENRLALEPTGHSSFRHDATPLTSSHANSMKSSLSLGLDGTSVSAKETVTLVFGSSFQTGSNEENQQRKLRSLGRGVDLNAVGNSSTVEFNPFYPLKKPGHIKSVYASECGSTTGATEEREPLRMWKEMKQNGFLSASSRVVSMPKQLGCPRKRKEDEPIKKVKFAKREQASKFTRIAAPSGLLSGLNPGIINHVRNSKQVYSIIEALLRSERLGGHSQTSVSDEMRRGSKRITEQRKEHICIHDSAINQFNLSPKKLPVFHSFDYRSTVSEVEIRRHDSCRGASMVSENASNASTDEISTNQKNINSLSSKAASVASQWLELLQLDIKGRLAALRRSKKRLRNVIQTELPYLFSREFIIDQENDPLDIGCSRKAISEMHVAHWESLFTEMDKDLYEEGKHLESWLKEVQEMQLHCEYGLKFLGTDGLSHSSDVSREPSKSDARQWKLALRAAAASIYSTCDLIMTTEDVPCFSSHSSSFLYPN